jgi:hypothetical protein
MKGSFYKRIMNESLYDDSQTQLANSYISRFDKDIKGVIKGIGIKDKKSAVELMKLYKKHWVEFSIKTKKVLAK